MAKFDVYPGSLESDSLLLDVQADLLDALNTRMVVPLMAVGKAPIPAKRLNPVFVIDGSEYVMVTQFMAAVPRAILRDPVANLNDKFRRNHGSDRYADAGVLRPPFTEPSTTPPEPGREVPDGRHAQAPGSAVLTYSGWRL